MTDTKKVAVISGGMGSVGRATAVAFAQEHYSVIVLYRNSSENDIAEARASLLGEHLFMRCDVSNTQDVARIIDDIVSKMGHIDVVVHTAVDPIKRERIIDMNEDAFRSQFEAGFFGAFNFLRSVGNVMKQQKEGTLIGITSSVIESPVTPARMGAYTVGKIALRGLLRELHRELSPNGVRVFAVAPELMHTQLHADLPEKFFEIAQERTSTNALMTPEEVARTIVQLCENTEFPSGSSYIVSSGTSTPL